MSSVFDRDAQKRYQKVLVEWDLAIRQIRALNERLEGMTDGAPEKVKVVRFDPAKRQKGDKARRAPVTSPT